jgi:hypothetical protein
MEGAVTIPICPNCRRQVPYRQVSTNVNGNQGRFLAKVRFYLDRILTCVTVLMTFPGPVQPVDPSG